jgi:bifunctional UDP-N-acetylglucosamine pyrophosphorylase/glucosamine-1-phosphate N-acetyltransferase
MADLMILAAGLGTRMQSRRAKVLHEIAGLPLITYPVRCGIELEPDTLVLIVGHQAEEVERVVREDCDRVQARGRRIPPLEFVLQTEQRGTGHAVMAARPLLENRAGQIVVIAGDGPLLKPKTLKRLLDTHLADRNGATLLTVSMRDPNGYGRVVRDPKGAFLRLVEQRDASPDQLSISETAVSIYCFEIPLLLNALDRLTADNAQREYYLTDVPHILAGSGERVGTLLHDDAAEVLGINTRAELASLGRILMNRKLDELMLAGVTIVDPPSTFISQDTEIGADTVIHPQVIIEGSSRLGSDCVVQSWSRLKDVEIGSGVIVKNSCIVEDSQIKDRASVGPFARLRMNAEIGEKAVIGNFVEVKKSKIGNSSKAQHLSYIGDATLGERVNIGAGTVTCNYDGVRKHETAIEDDVKIGSDTMLVAPVRVGKGSVTGAGAVVTKDVPPDSLAVGVPAVIKKKVK